MVQLVYDFGGLRLQITQIAPKLVVWIINRTLFAFFKAEFIYEMMIR